MGKRKAGTPPPLRRVKEFFTKIHGVSHGNRQKLLKQLRPGQPLQLIREPNNPHDHNAIMVCVTSGLLRRSQQLGYLSADIAERYAPHLDAGGNMSATVSQVTGGGGWLWWKKSYGCNIVVRVE